MFMCCIGWIESLSSPVSVALSHSRVPYPLNWVTLMCCIRWIESLSSPVSVALSHSHLLCRLHCLSHVICCIDFIVWVSLIPLYQLFWLCCICLTFRVMFIACHPSLLHSTLLTQRARILIFSISSTNLLLGAFVKLRKASISFVVSVCLSNRLSFCMGQLCSHWIGFHEIRNLSTSRKSVDRIQVSLKSGKNKGYFTWRRKYVYEIILLISSKNKTIVQKVTTHILCSVTCFRKSCPLWGNVAKYGSAWQDT